jgi:hypothetical protein
MRSILVKLLALENSLALVAATDEAEYKVWYTTNSVTWDLAWNVSFNAARDAAKLGKSPKELSNQTCASVMKNYNNILSSIDNIGCMIKFRENFNLVTSLRRLVTFDDEAIKKLGLMNHRFRLFYLFRVHELLSLLKNNREKLMTDFYNLVKKLGDLKCYNKLFVSNIPLEMVENVTSISRDVVKVILDYSELSIYEPGDVVFISNKIAGGATLPL